MRVFILGGTGSIGEAIVQVLQERNHQVYALGRTPESREQLRKAGAIAVKGDLRDPSEWIDICDEVDGVVQAAAVWGDEMGNIDQQVVDALLDKLQTYKNPKAFIYTGGCWLYGETGDVVATEETEFDSLAGFDWGVSTIKQVLSAENVRGMVIHPAMVYERNGGVFEHIFEDAEKLGYVRVIGGKHVRWPLIHRLDLAMVYTLMLEQGKQGDVYNAAANHAVLVGEITQTIAARLGIYSDPVVCDVETAIAEIGSWAEGYAIDQQMSGEKARSKLNWVPIYEDVFAEIS